MNRQQPQISQPAEHETVTIRYTSTQGAERQCRSGDVTDFALTPDGWKATIAPHNGSRPLLIEAADKTAIVKTKRTNHRWARIGFVERLEVEP